MPLILFVIAGIVLVLNPTWFVGAATVGWILIIFFGFWTIIFTLIFFGAIGAAAVGTKRSRRW